MKSKIFLSLSFILTALVGCSDDDAPDSRTMNHDVAYVSVRIKTPNTTQTVTRSSTEESASNQENAVKTLYAVTFDDGNTILQYGNDSPAVELEDFHTDGTSTHQMPSPFKISAKATRLLLVANPGTELLKVLNGLQAGGTFDTFNAAIANVDASEIEDDTEGFTMINVGATVNADNDNTPNGTLCLIDVSTAVKAIDDYATEAEAIQDAKDNPVNVNIERLSSKVFVHSKIPDGSASEKVLPQGAVFYFDGWTLDGVNGTFFPWAKTVKLASAPITTNFYKHNFYTIDPNYANNTGIVYNKVDPTTRVPKTTFLAEGEETYCLENTMKATEQRFQNATRVVIKARYYPNGWTGDWFKFGNDEYENLAALQTAYAIPTNTNLIEACDKFYNAVKQYATDISKPISAGDFESLTEAELADLPNGGEAVKEDGCIKWFKDGLCYYWYEIRHDDAITASRAFAKYGVVRNNIYNLTLNSVKRPGTPWYPNIDPDDPNPDPDPNEPDPTDPIDEFEGYIDVTVEIGPWVKWEHSIDL